MTIQQITAAIENYTKRTRHNPALKAALIDMDGIIYDSMPYHTLAWHKMMTEAGIKTQRDDFYLYEGMTGAATLRLVFNKELGRDPSEEEIKTLYARKTEIFVSEGKKKQMPGAALMLSSLRKAGIDRILVTGSGQHSLITSLETDFPSIFSKDKMVTAADVIKGKPDPEPYLRGLEKAGADPWEAIVIENAPLGIESGHASGAFCIGVTTGPVPARYMSEAGADLIFASMPEFALHVPTLINLLK